MLMNLTMISHQEVTLKGGKKIFRPNTLETVASYDTRDNEETTVKSAHKRIRTRIQRNYRRDVKWPEGKLSKEAKDAILKERDMDVNLHMMVLNNDLDKFVKTGERVERVIHKNAKPHFTYIFEPHTIVITNDVPDIVCFEQLPSKDHTNTVFTNEEMFSKYWDERTKAFTEWMKSGDPSKETFDQLPMTLAEAECMVVVPRQDDIETARATNFQHLDELIKMVEENKGTLPDPQVDPKKIKIEGEPESKSTPPPSGVKPKKNLGKKAQAKANRKKSKKGRK
ncbi:hypothetical protein NVP1253O_51 [Vibrio phage 1.253.O._10N.286.45.B12]|nr:hypothetical protein NVP1235O_51 [Vibrio phage 1.235.O._10N.261.52.B2]AUR98575.1 hypothetical protein NVP1253O_51 [Vibrio phage 1.253.O._10N.286.45.B12]